LNPSFVDIPNLHVIDDLSSAIYHAKLFP
jgi:hypothetical protein